MDHGSIAFSPLLCWGLLQMYWDSTGAGLGNLKGAPAPHRSPALQEPALSINPVY